MEDKTKKTREKICEIIEVGTDYDFASRTYDYINAGSIISNLAASILYTFDYMETRFGPELLVIEYVTAVFFAIDYILRVWTADCLHPELSRRKATLKYIFSFSGLMDLFSFLPYAVPGLPAGAVAFRLVRLIRIFRLFRINSYYDSLKVIWDVIYGKRQQLISSVSIILILMLGSSLCMYGLEHDAQPEVFKNALSGIWWSASTLLTVGYGDIYPITTAGKVFGIFITFLGVGMVAIPTGIISAGFVDQYSRVKKMNEYGKESDVQFIKIQLTTRDPWVGETIEEIELPENTLVAMVKRGRSMLIPKGDMILEEGDILVIGAEALGNDESESIELKEIELNKNHPWTDHAIDDLDISRKTMIVLVKRKDRTIIPNGDLILREGDTVILYTQKYLPQATNIEV